MKYFIVAFVALTAITAYSDQEDFNQEEAKNRKIIVFKPGASDDAMRSAIQESKGKPGKKLASINAMAAHLPEGAAEAIRSHPNVARVDDDLIIEALVVKDSVKEGESIHGQGKGGPAPTPQPAQETPWGINRVKAPEAWSTSQGAGVNVCVIDTGIDLNHPDLQANIKKNVNTINPSKTAEDDNGHGTHVAGAIAAINNTIGVVGIAPQANLFAIKALSRSGSGWLSDIIEGLDWCVKNSGKVANMSLGSSSDNQSFHDAIIAAANAGLTIVAAAGNSGPCSNCVIYPARYPEVIAASASDTLDQLASFSSQGPEVDLIAPGKDIRSTYKGDGYATASGTSMATPHVTASAALKLAQNPALTPDQVAASLKSSADLLPNLTSDQQGSGIINCQKLVALP